MSVSEHNTAAWRSVLPVVECVPNGVQLDHWRDRGIAEPGLAVWAGRITPEKGPHVAIDAVRAAGLRLELSGPVAHRSYFETEIAPRLGDDVSWVGHLEHEVWATSWPGVRCSCRPRCGRSRSG